MAAQPPVPRVDTANAAHQWMPPRLCAVCFLMLLACSFASGTSVVASLGVRRIILAADTREDVLEPGFSGSAHHFDDFRCKLVPLGPTAVAVVGNVTYKKNIPTDPISDWDALSDAKAAYAAHRHDLHQMATDWAHRSVLHYALFYAVAPERVRQLASVNEEHVLVDAFVTGWQGHTPMLYWEKVYLDGSMPSTIQMSEQLLPYRELPYTTNGMTQTLFEGDSKRTAATAAEWREQFPNIPAKQRNWRWIEFLVRLTGRYDESVGPDVNVIQIPVGGQAEWIQNLTCRD